ncbi:MAG: multicopper oxidase family protein [Burkholderiales bacterium]|nr:multicopper oxidase family protein [Burkholderiales bacterium]
MRILRRTVLKTLAAAPLLPLITHKAAAAPRAVTLTAAPAKQRLVPDYPETEIWGFNGAVPGPELRFRQGETARIIVENRLTEETTVHWHGLRVPNAMDGVPHLTQPPVAKGGRFVYEFPLPDAGTYWYHPHLRGHEQVARGLYGAFIVEEREPIRVDRDVTWVLSDWQLMPDAQQRGDFDNLMEMAHAGRIGNTVTVNGKFTAADGTFAVRSGERIRLRLINAAVARIFLLRFPGHEPRVIACDGQAVEPHSAPADGLELGPGMRVDLVLDCMQAPGSRHDINDDANPRRVQRVIALAYNDEAPLRSKPLDAPVLLAPNPLPEPDLARAVRHDILFQGGAMGTLREAELEGKRLPLSTLARQHGLAWAINGITVKEHAHAPLLTFKRGASVVLAMNNETSWPHPIHLHGHVFRVIARDGRPTRYREWADTVLMGPRERVDIAFVADNPGDWMFHCHILAHQHGGMMTVFRVT